MTMKKMILVLAFLMAAFVQAGKAQTSGTDSVAPALTTEQHIARMDSLMETVSQQLSRQSVAASADAAATRGWLGELGGEIVPVVSIVFVFGMPVLVLFFFFFFRYKTRKAQYEAVVKALEAGRDVPDELFLAGKKKNLRSDGIMSIFTGLGLGIFLWAITGQFGIGCIGFMIMLIGIGQLIAHRAQTPSSGEPFIRMHRDENTGEATLKFGGIELTDRKKKEETENGEE